MGYIAGPYQKARSVNSTSTSFSAPAATNTEPAGDAGTAAGASVIQVARGGPTPDVIEVMPYGIGNDDQTFDIQVYSWHRHSVGSNKNQTIWIAKLLAQIACTLSTYVGLANSPILATERFADTITISTEPVWTADTTNAGSIKRMSPANNTPAWVQIPYDGGEKIELRFDMTGATSGNALLRFLSK